MPGLVARSVMDVGRLADGDLAALAATGDAAAFRLIMERNNARLYRTARAVLRNDGEAEDVVQEAYVRAYGKLGTFRGEASLSTWLTRIALNEALGRIRKRRPSEELSAVDNETVPNRGEVIWFPGMPNDTDPERAVARREISGLLERAIDALPEAFRIVFVLRAVEDMSVEDTAATLAIPEATVKTRLYRARRLLRETIEEELGPAVADAFPFAGRRCARTTEIVLERLGLALQKGGHAID